MPGKKPRLLIGYDGSAFSDAALKDLKKSGLPRQAEALVISAANVFLPSGPEIKIPEPIKSSIQQSRNAAAAKLKQAEALARRAHKKIKALFPAWNVKHETAADDPSWALIKKAASWKPELVLVGAHGHSTLGRYFGSTSQMVVNQAPCSIRVGRASARTKSGPLRIMIGIDGSKQSAAVIKTVAARVWPPRTKFLLVTAIGSKKPILDRLAPSEIRWLIDKADDGYIAAGRMLEAFANKLRLENFSVTCEARKGKPQSVLVKEARDWRADCVFIGSHAWTPLKRFFRGGVSTVVASGAPCSVEVVRSPA